jgi:hypothetical protein
MFCVLVGSQIDGWSKPDNCTGSIVEARASDRESPAEGLCVDDVESNGTMSPPFRQGKVLLAEQNPSLAHSEPSFDLKSYENC